MNTANADRTKHDIRETNRHIPLAPAEIHVWLAFFDEITDEHLHSAYRELLNAAEREQEARFYFAKDRRRYLISRALVRTVLSRYIAVCPQEWIFSAGTYGRPEIVNAPARDAGLVFNISHTHGLIVMAVTRRHALGVDVENFRVREGTIDIANRYFAPHEVAALSAAPHYEQQYRFFEYWTFKESYIKTRGMGFFLPLDKFSFHYPNDRAVEITIQPELADDSARWQFWQFRPTPEHVVAVCSERVSTPRPGLVVWQAIPMQCENKVTHELLRM